MKLLGTRRGPRNMSLGSREAAGEGPGQQARMYPLSSPHPSLEWNDSGGDTT